MKDPRFAKFVVLVNGFVPIALLAWDSWQGTLGANPKDKLLHTTGMMALICLILSLSVTPLRMVTGKNWLSNFRKMLGLYAFFYGCMHLLIYFVRDQGMNLLGVFLDTWKRPFILYGMTSLLVMLPLALTSTNGAIKRMGSANWKKLHKLAYVAGVAGVVHYYSLVKQDIRLPVVFIVILSLLLGYRVLLVYFPNLKYRKDTGRAKRAFPTQLVSKSSE